MLDGTTDEIIDSREVWEPLLEAKLRKVLIDETVEGTTSEEYSLVTEDTSLGRVHPGTSQEYKVWVVDEKSVTTTSPEVLTAVSTEVLTNVVFAYELLAAEETRGSVE